MDRREMLKKVGAVIGLSVIAAAPESVNASGTGLEDDPIKLHFKDDPKPINGVGFIRYPTTLIRMKDGTDVPASEIAKSLAEHIHQGCIICLPNSRDYMGEYEWNFTIVDGPIDQVTVERKEEGK